MTARQVDYVERVEIDPKTHPILAQHWGPIEPAWQHVGDLAATVVERLAARQAADSDDRDAAA